MTECAECAECGWTGARDDCDLMESGSGSGLRLGSATVTGWICPHCRTQWWDLMSALYKESGS